MKTRESYQYIPCEFTVVKSDIQKTLDSQGCVFREQELLSNHELDMSKNCYCGRRNKIKVGNEPDEE